MKRIIALSTILLCIAVYLSGRVTVIKAQGPGSSYSRLIGVQFASTPTGNCNTGQVAQNLTTFVQSICKADGTWGTPSAGGGGTAFPVTVTGGVSGAVPCFTSTTVESAGTLLATNALVVGGGAGACPATGNADFTYATDTLTGAAAGLVDLSAETGAGAFKVPVQAAAAPTANGAVSYDSTCNDNTFGTNTATRYMPFTLRANASGDQLSAAGTFATTLSVPSGCLFAKSIVVIKAHGVFTTTATASPLMIMQVNAGGTSGICAASAAGPTLVTSKAGGSWDAVCSIEIATTGNPGTAYAWGEWQAFNQATNTLLTNSPLGYQNASTVNYITTTSQTVSIQETATFVSGQTANLQYITADISPE